MTDKNLKIGIFGASFNPLHFGHLNLLVQVQERFQFDKIRVTPARKSPFTAGPLPAPEKRLAIVRRALKDYPFLLVDDQEIKRKGPSYTIDTVESLIREKPLCKDIFLIMGMDQWLCFDRWRNFKALMEKTQILVCSRKGCGPFLSPLFLKKYIVSSEVNKKALLNLKTGRGGSIKLLTNKRLYYLPLNDMDIASSQIRTRCKKGLFISHLTPPAVVRWIQKNKFYQDSYPSDEKKEQKPSSLLRFCAKALLDKQAKKVKAFDLRKFSGLAFDFTLVVSGLNTRHTKMMAGHLLRRVKKEFAASARHIEGREKGEWIVLDYGDLAVHIFYDYTREYYRLEELWDQAPVQNF